MLLGKSKKSVIYGSAILMGLFVSFVLFSMPVVHAGGKASAAASSAFRTKCAVCHGPDGAGSEVGKSMNVPDLRSSAIRKTSDSQLTQVIANGKNGMPSFKSSLNEAQIHDIVAYIRTLATNK